MLFALYFNGNFVFETQNTKNFACGASIKCFLPVVFQEIGGTLMIPPPFQYDFIFLSKFWKVVPPSCTDSLSMSETIFSFSEKGNSLKHFCQKNTGVNLRPLSSLANLFHGFQCRNRVKMMFSDVWGAAAAQKSHLRRSNDKKRSQTVIFDFLSECRETFFD